MSSIYTKDELQILNQYWSNIYKISSPLKKYEWCEYNNEVIVHKLLNWFENETGIVLINKSNPLIIHKFNEGGFFSKHQDDALPNGNIYKRKAWAVGFLITNDYEGGDFQLYNPDEVLNKEVGKPYCFPCDRWHEIKPVTKGVRKSGIIFINYTDIKKKSLY